MKKINYLALFLALVMVFALTACSGGTAETAAPASEAPAAETEAPAAETAEPTAQQELHGGVAWPLVEDEAVITVWHSVFPFLPNYMENMNENSVLKYIAEQTNVYLDTTSFSGFAMAEQFPVMIAAGEYTDMIGNVAALYSGGLSAAIEDEVIIDMAPYAEEYLPNFMARLGSNPDWEKTAYDDEGRLGAFLVLSDSNLGARGLIIRQDYLDELGLETPTTYDEMHDTLTAFKTELGLSGSLYLNYMGQSAGNTLANGFGTFASYSAAEGVLPYYVEDGTVKFAYTEPAFLEYLTTMHQWYEEGLIMADFATNDVGVTVTGTQAEDKFFNGDLAVLALDAGGITTALGSFADPDADLRGIADLTKTEGETLHYAQFGSQPQSNWAISTDCEQVELVMTFWDYFYSDEGAFLATWGLEGEAFNYDENGEPQYTELVTQHEGTTMVSYQMYCLNDVPCFILAGRSASAYSDVDLEAAEIWVSNQDGAGYYPSGATLTPDESEAFNANWNDLATYFEENISRFILGELNLEADYDAFVAQLQAMGIDECTALKQAAYDRYLQR